MHSCLCLVRGLGGIASFRERGRLRRNFCQPKQCLLHIHSILETVFGTHIESIVDSGKEVMAVAAFIAAAGQLGLSIFASDAGGGFFNQLVGNRLVDTGTETV